MQFSNLPSLIALPFADNGTKNTIPLASQIGIVNGAASLTDGFPPLTFIPTTDGGIPPFGADFNGILYLISSVSRWSQVGGSYIYNSAFAISIGGYPKGAVLSRTDFTGFWQSTIDSNLSDPDAGGTGWQALNNFGSVTIPLTNADVVLTPAQAAKKYIFLTGTLTDDVTITVPSAVNEYVFINQTVGSFAIAVIALGGGGVILLPGLNDVFVDGVNVVTPAGGGGSPGTGTVTSVNVSGGMTGLTFAGGPVTNAGTITMSGTLAVANGGTGAVTPTAARIALGLVIGTDVQAQSATLQGIDTVGALTANTFWARASAGGLALKSITDNALAFLTNMVGTNITGTAAGLNIGGNAATATSAGSAIVAQDALNIDAGAANQIPVQSAPSVTTFIVAPTVSSILSWTGSAFVWLANFVLTTAANVFTNQQAVTPYRANISGAYSLDLAGVGKSNNLNLTLTANVSSFALTNPVDGGFYTIRFIQDATGGWTMPALPASFKFPSGVAPVFSPAPNAVDLLSLQYGATEGTYMAVFSKDMR